MKISGRTFAFSVAIIVTGMILASVIGSMVDNQLRKGRKSGNGTKAEKETEVEEEAA